MPHFLCFTDLSLTTTTPGNPIKSSVVAKDAAADSTPPPSSSAPACAVAGAGRRHRHTTCFFVRDGDKKSSFALERPVALLVDESSDHERRGGDGNARQTLAPPPSSSPAAAADGDDDCADEEEREERHGGDRDHESQLLFEKVSRDDNDDAGGGEKFASTTAAASITSCCVSSSAENGDGSASSSSSREEKFLFGGFELIANVGTVEVHAVRSTDAASIPSAEEAYLTTCKGVPMRDLPGLSTIPLCVDGTSSGTEEEELRKEIKYGHDERSTIERDILFYKFIFVMPGGPKPMERVRLKFARMNDVSPPVHGLIIVRTLKVKGRLSDSVPKKIPGGQLLSTSQRSTPPPIGPAANFFTGGMPSSVEGRDGMSGGLASMMAMFGGGDDAIESPHMNPRQHRIRQMQLQSCDPRNSQHRRDDDHQHRQEKNQAEIMSSVAGLGIFLRSSEERMADKLETMLAGIEMRITNRLDGLAARLDAIEQSLVHDESSKKR